MASTQWWKSLTVSPIVIHILQNQLLNIMLTFPTNSLKMGMSDTKENLLHKHIISLVNKKNCVNWKQGVLGASKEPQDWLVHNWTLTNFIKSWEIINLLQCPILQFNVSKKKENMHLEIHIISFTYKNYPNLTFTRYNLINYQLVGLPMLMN